MSDMKAFEIHTYQGGKWKIDSVFDDRELALFEAQRMDGSGRYSGIRVVEEIYLERTQETKSRTIYRGSKIEAANAAELRKSKLVREQAADNRKKRTVEAGLRQRAVQEKRIRKKSSPVRLIVITALIVVLAGAAMFGLQFAEHGM
ncbi:MAG: hypothetical protein WD470_02290 [Rhodospirillaceae bacterium]